MRQYNLQASLERPRRSLNDESLVHFLEPKELVKLVQRAICKLPGYTVRVLGLNLNSAMGNQIVMDRSLGRAW